MKLSLRNPLLLLTLGALAFTACDEDLDPREEANNRLVGDWDVTSLTIDGVEQMQVFITSFEMEYEKTDPFEGEGEWTLIGANGNVARSDGDYEIEDGGDGIEFDGIDFDLDLDGDDVEFEGILDGERWIIQAERD